MLIWIKSSAIGNFEYTQGKNYLNNSAHNQLWKLQRDFVEGKVAGMLKLSHLWESLTIQHSEEAKHATKM